MLRSDGRLNPLLHAVCSLISILSIVVLAAHLIAVDLAMAAPLACIWLGRRASRQADPLAGVLERRLAKQALLALAFGMVLGTLQLGVLWLADDRSFFAAARRLPAGRLWFSLAELVFFFGCMAAYLEVRRWPRQIPWLAGALAVLAATDLMYHFPPLFAMLGLLAQRPELHDQILTGTLYRSLLIDPEVLAMVVHVWLAAVALTGVAVMHLASAAEPTSPGAELAEPAVGETNSIMAVAARWALGASLLQLPVGLWVLLSVGSGSRRALLGADLIGSLEFLLAILAALGLMHHLAAVTLGDARPAQVRRSVALMLAVIVLMTAALHRTRTGSRESKILPAVGSSFPAGTRASLSQIATKAENR